MSNSKITRISWQAGLCLALGTIWACSIPEPPQTGNAIPSEYAKKHMPEGWWTDQSIINEGQELYLGTIKPNVNCAKCHGKIGKPVMTSARDLRNTDTMKKYSDSHMFWRISEGVPYSTMGAYKNSLSEEEIWKVVVFVSTLGLDGLQYDPSAQSWVPTG